MKIIELQNELREIRSDKLSNEARMLELRDQLAESRTSFESLKKNMETDIDGTVIKHLFCEVINSFIIFNLLSLKRVRVRMISKCYCKR